MQSQQLYYPELGKQAEVVVLPYGESSVTPFAHCEAVSPGPTLPDLQKSIHPAQP